MTQYSQNGYVACDPSLIAKYTVPGTSVTVNLRKGDVSVVLLHFMEWFNANVQKLRQSDTGGYNPRVIAGSHTLSNHASGTAVDLDWDSHPQGRRNAGFSAAQVTAIHKQLEFYGGAIRWGNDYTGTPDAMHFEINQDPAHVALIANKCRTGYEHPAGSRVLDVASPVMTGHDVTVAQQKVGLAGGAVDGKYGTGTASAVKVYQGKHKLTKDGIVGPATWASFGVKYTGK